jgi:HAD superfamily hydrolase (TIGR01549 family)
MAADALLFDLDGTLADTHLWYAEALAACCSQGAEQLGDTIRAGTPAISLARKLRIERGFLRECRAASDRLPFYDGVREGLDELRRRATPLGLVTSLSPIVAKVLLNGTGLGAYFGAVVAAERGIRPKPHPGPVLAGLQRMGLKPSTLIYYVGDHVNDERSAHSAGVRFAWARYGYQTAPPTEPDAVLDRFLDVLKL